MNNGLLRYVPKVLTPHGTNVWIVVPSLGVCKCGLLVCKCAKDTGFALSEGQYCKTFHCELGRLFMLRTINLAFGLLAHVANLS